MNFCNSLSLLRSNYAVIFAIRKKIYQNMSIKALHSLRQCKQKKPIRSFGRKLMKGAKGVKKKEDGPKLHPRDIIRNIYNLLRNCSWSSAQEQLERLPMKWESYLITQVLKTHPPLEKAWLFFNWASMLPKFRHDQYSYTTMLDIFGEAGRIASMNHVFQQMKDKGMKIDAVTYTSLMHWLSNSGDVDGAIKVWKEMKSNRCRPTVVSYTAYIKILLDNDHVKEANDAYKEMIELGIPPNIRTYTILMEYLIGAGNCEEALDIFHKMQDADVYPDKAACNILIMKCCRSGEREMRVMTKILEYMREKHIVLRYPVFVEAHETLKSFSVSDTLLMQVNPHIEAELVSKNEAMHVSTSSTIIPSNLDHDLMEILLKMEKLIAVDYLLTGMLDKNIPLDSAIISSIIEVNCKHNRPDGALLVFDYCLKNEVIMERHLYLGLIGVSIRSSLYSKLWEVVQEMYRQGHCLGVYHATLILYRLGKAGKPQYAMKIFNMLPEELKCTATYTALVGAYLSARNYVKGLKIYETMREKGFRPSLGTYNMLLTGLEKSGKVNELAIYRREKKSFEIHYHADHNIIQENERICDLLYAGMVS